MLSKDIGVDAGVILSLLLEKGKLNLRKIGELTNKKEAVIFMAIGWLLRENKISAFQEAGDWYFTSCNVFSEAYY